MEIPILSCRNTFDETNAGLILLRKFFLPSFHGYRATPGDGTFVYLHCHETFFCSDVKLVPQPAGACPIVRHDKSAFYLPCSDNILVCYFNLQPGCPLEVPSRNSDRHFGWSRGRWFVRMSSDNAMMPRPQPFVLLRYPRHGLTAATHMLFGGTSVHQVLFERQLNRAPYGACKVLTSTALVLFRFVPSLEQDATPPFSGRHGGKPVPFFHGWGDVSPMLRWHRVHDCDHSCRAAEHDQLDELHWERNVRRSLDRDRASPPSHRGVSNEEIDCHRVRSGFCRPLERRHGCREYNGHIPGFQQIYAHP